MKNNFKILLNNSNNAQTIKNLINEMYRSEYETRTLSQIETDILNGIQVFVVVYYNDKPIGFAGASIKSDEYLDAIKNVQTVIDFVYVKESYRGFYLAYHLMKALLNHLACKGINSAILEVQTFNKQRFLHYALADKNIIKSTKCKDKNGVEFENQVLLIKNINKVLTLSTKDFIKKVKEYSKIYH